MMRWPWTKQQRVMEAEPNWCAACGHLEKYHDNAGACGPADVYFGGDGCGCPSFVPQRSVNGNQNPTPDASEGPGDVPEHQCEHQIWLTYPGVRDVKYCEACPAIKLIGSAGKLIYVPEPLPISPPVLQRTGVEGEGWRQDGDVVVGPSPDGVGETGFRAANSIEAYAALGILRALTQSRPACEQHDWGPTMWDQGDQYSAPSEYEWCSRCGTLHQNGAEVIPEMLLPQPEGGE